MKDLLWFPEAGLEDFKFQPARAGDAGFDLPVYLPAERFMEIHPDQFLSVPTGIKVKLPFGYWALIKARSSAHFRKRLLVIDGVIDEGYTGPLFSMVYNPTRNPIRIEHLERITQLILLPLCVPPASKVQELPKTERGSSGFGSTGGLHV